MTMKGCEHPRAALHSFLNPASQVPIQIAAYKGNQEQRADFAGSSIARRTKGRASAGGKFDKIQNIC